MLTAHAAMFHDGGAHGVAPVQKKWCMLAHMR